MVNPWDVTKNVINAVSGGATDVPFKLIDARIQSSDNNSRDGNLKDDGDNTWKDDRQTINNEWNLLNGQYNKPAPTVLNEHNKEPFATWSHEQIWKALNGDGKTKGVEQADINSGADGWRQLTKQARDAVDTFRRGVDQDIESLWKGRAANSAMEATRTYTDDFKKLHVSFQEVANGIDLIQGYLDQAKRSVSPPENVSGFDEFVGHIPGNGVLKLGKHRANEAQASAQERMKEYAAGADLVDGKTPLLPEPLNAVSKPDDKPKPSEKPTSEWPSSGKSPDGKTTDDPKSTENPTTNDPNASDDNPQSTSPASTPAATTPTPTGTPTTPAGTPNTPGLPDKSNLENPLGRPGSPGGIPGGTPSGPGKSVPGNPASQLNGAGGPGNRGSKAAAGRAGAPGMGAPGSRGKNGEDDDEHHSPDYLIQDRTTELLGEQPRVLPPGGVIGG
ncbi:hypothetical protein ACLMAJ_37575 [Nocardia sp. KC 131]|uniref:hypothetical protein n=1 Tax=Nocardia arseniciresistens TaxID=3392119 RepID=UPI00398F8686